MNLSGSSFLDLLCRTLARLGLGIFLFLHGQREHGLLPIAAELRGEGNLGKVSLRYTPSPGILKAVPLVRRYLMRLLVALDEYDSAIQWVSVATK